MMDRMCFNTLRVINFLSNWTLSFHNRSKHANEVLKHPIKFPHDIFAVFDLLFLKVLNWINRSFPYLTESLHNSLIESGSTARNATARISTAQHFFQKCHLLDTKSINCLTDKSMPYVYHISFSSSWKTKVQLLKISSSW
jgi:hypothetical protein